MMRDKDMTNPRTYYVLHTISERGQLHEEMYCSGARADSAELAKFARGNLIRTKRDREPRRLCVLRVDPLPGTWTDSAGCAHQRYDNPVVVELEPQIGDWG